MHVQTDLASQVPDRAPVGNIEDFDGVRLRGWMADGSSTPLRVQVYLNGNFFGEVTADILREDVIAAGKGTAHAGFELPVPRRYFSSGPCEVVLVDTVTGTHVLPVPFVIPQQSAQVWAARTVGQGDAAFLWPPSGDVAALPASTAVARAFVEGMIATDACGAVVFGWALHHPAQELLLMAVDGGTTPFAEFFRFSRADVASAYPASPWSHLACGFVGYVPDVVPGQEVLVAVREGDTLRQLGAYRVPVATTGTLVDTARHLFGVATPLGQFAERAVQVDWPLLTRVQAEQRRLRSVAEVRRCQVGHPPGDAAVSLIVPLYGRLDFIEAQLAEFAADPTVRSRAEIIYVVDDPALWDAAVRKCRTWSRLHGIGMRLVGGDINRGFSGANNLGVAASHADLLLFLNSDVIPTAPGWLDAMLSAWQRCPDAGAVGAQLVYADDGLQHAGMAFQRHHDFGIWINTHPLRGLAAGLDSGPEVEEVAAVTGACLLTSRMRLAEAGGWDEGYLVGDFEDSHLCLALRARGLRSYYVRAARLVHLERQSFRQLGDADFRQRVVIANAARHQAIWADVIEGIVSP